MKLQGSLPSKVYNSCCYGHYYQQYYQDAFQHLFCNIISHITHSTLKENRTPVSWLKTKRPSR